MRHASNAASRSHNIVSRSRPRGRRALVAAALLAGATWSAVGLAEQTLSTVSWSRLEREGKLPPAEVHAADATAKFEYLEIRNPATGPVTVPLAALDKPGITAARYALRGHVRYEGMTGNGYLEMWSFFPGGGRYFSRTLAGAGPMASLEGSSPWRPFVLPFDTNGQGLPERLTIGVSFGGPGTIFLGPVELVQFSGSESPLTPAGAWWSERQGGMVGGLAGGVIGIAGTLIGVLGGMGRARRAVLALLTFMIAASLVMLFAGVAALVMHQAYAVYYPLLLIGVIGVAVPSFLFAALRRRYEELELRRMSALDTSRA